MSIEITQEYLRRHFFYNPDTGILSSIIRDRRRPPDGEHGAGRLSPRGYIRMYVLGKRIDVHRLIWMYVHGRWPLHTVDHINLCRSDNRLSNLREADNQQQQANTHCRKQSRSGFKGVCLHKKTGKWQAAIGIKNRIHYLGLFETAEAAHARYCAAAAEAFGSYARQA